MNSTLKVAFADDFTVVGKLTSIKEYWSQLTYIGRNYSYYPRTSKSYFIVKEDQLRNATFNNSNVNITVEGKRYLGAVVGSEIFKFENVNISMN